MLPLEGLCGERLKSVSLVGWGEYVRLTGGSRSVSYFTKKLFEKRVTLFAGKNLQVAFVVLCRLQDQKCCGCFAGNASTRQQKFFLIVGPDKSIRPLLRLLAGLF